MRTAKPPIPRAALALAAALLLPAGAGAQVVNGALTTPVTLNKSTSRVPVTDPLGSPVYAGTFSFTARFCNNGTQGNLVGLGSLTTVMTNNNGLINRHNATDPSVPRGVDSVRVFETTGDYSDAVLGGQPDQPTNECVDVPYQVGLTNFSRFQFNIEAYAEVWAYSAQVVVAPTVVEGSTVALSAITNGTTGSETCTWAQTVGSPVTITPDTATDPSGCTASFAATFTPELTSPEDLEFEVTVNDGGQAVLASGATTVQPAGIAVFAGNDFNANPGQLFTLHAIGACLTTGAAPTPIACGTGGTYSWTQVVPAPGDAGYVDYGIDGSTNSNPQASVAIPTTSPVNMLFEVSYTGNGKTATDQVAVFVRDPQQALANAPLTVNGAWQVQPLVVVAPASQGLPFGETVDLTASVTGGDGNYRYLWEVLATLDGSTGLPPTDPDCDATLTNETSATATVTLPAYSAGNNANCNIADVRYGLAVLVQDQGVDIGSPGTPGMQEALDLTNLLASPLGTTTPLNAAAPPRQTTEGQFTRMEATGIGGTQPYSYSWVQTGPESSPGVLDPAFTVTLTGPDTATPSFTAPAVDDLTVLSFEIEITDANSDVATVSTSVSVRDTFALAPSQLLRLQPLAPITAESGATIPLAVGYAGGTPPIATWAWTETTSTGAVITGGNTATPTVTLPTNTGSSDIPVTLQVTATDSGTGSGTPPAQTASELVQITVKPAPIPLATVIVPDQHADEGAPTNLHVTASGGSGGYSYLWTQTGPTLTGGGLDPKFAVTLTNANTATASFTAPAVSGRQPLTFEVQVTSGGETKTVPVTVVINDITPTIQLASKTPITVKSGDTHRITGVTPQGGSGALTYAWAQTAPASPAATITDETTLNPQIVFPTVTAETAFTFELAVTDALGNVAKVTQSFSVQPTVPAAAPAKPLTIPGKPGVACYTCGTVKVQAGSLSGYNWVRDYDPGAVEDFLQAGGSISPENVPCSRMELVTRHQEQCPDEKPYCMNDIYQVDGQTADLFKRCVNEATCHELWFMESSDKVACFKYDPSTIRGDLICHLCCYGERCNENLLPPVEKLYQP